MRWGERKEKLGNTIKKHKVKRDVVSLFKGIFALE